MAQLQVAQRLDERKFLSRLFTDAVLISTFGWTPIACAAALKGLLEVHQRDKTWESSRKERTVYHGKN